MRFLYTAGIRFYGFLIHLAAMGNSKAAEWVQGRKTWKRQLLDLAPEFSEGRWLWFHVASMGEYEQAAPLVEACRSQHPGYRILLSFFSPSGYRHWAKKNVADAVVYIPLDTPSDVRFFLDTCCPAKAIFIKYEYWFNFIRELNRRNIPLYFVSSRFRDSQYFFKPWGRWFVSSLKTVSAFFVQDSHSVELLKSRGFKSVYQAGDTRFDRVMKIVSVEVDYPIVKNFARDRRLLMSGSSWPEDEAVMLDYMASKRSSWAWVIVPHELQPERLSALRKKLESKSLSVSFYSECEPEGLSPCSDVLVVDKMGLLSKLYRYADLAYIGGGFGKGIHNVLEAAAYGVPVLFGPNCRKFGEALGLLGCEGGFLVKDAGSFASLMDYLSDPEVRGMAAIRAGNFVKGGTGVVDSVMEVVFKGEEE